MVNQENCIQARPLMPLIFAPLEPATNKANAMMRAFNTGMAVFDGIVLGVKVMKKFRKIFGRKR